MSNSQQFKALLIKNFIVMKRNWFSTCCLFVFPIILFIGIALIRRAIKTEVVGIKSDIELINNSTHYSSSLFNTRLNPLEGINIINPFGICRKGNRKNFGIVKGTDGLNDFVKKYILEDSFNNLTSLEFSSEQEMFEYVRSPEYELSKPSLCFGFGVKKNSELDYEYTINYFSPITANINRDRFYLDIPSTLIESLSPFQSYPMIDEYIKWQKSGAIYVINLINNAIVQDSYTLNSIKPVIRGSVIPMKYPNYEKDDIGRILSFLVPFFIVVIYMIPLIIFVYRMIRDKELRIKEGMKIMGMTDLSYFLSYFVQYLIINFIIALIGGGLLGRAIGSIHFGIRFGFLFMYGLSIFGLIYIFQALIDKSTLGIIMSIMIYYITYFVSPAVSENEVSNSSKMAASLLSPTSLQLGFNTIAQFETSKIPISGFVSYRYKNFSVGDMFIMFTIDFFLYLFIGFYLENVIPHQYGIQKPWYFLFTSSYWCGTDQIQNTDDKNEELNNKKEENFQDESNYQKIYKQEECLRILNIQKTFDDGKVALKGASLNLYKNEIFALLGHNGAGKSTLINIMSGLYQSSGGKVMYNGINCLNNISEFRKKIGICPQHDVLFNDLTVEEHLRLFANFKGVNHDNIEKEIDNILSELELLNKRDDYSSNLSGGQKRKLSIAIALIGNSEIVFLDEPSSGMDITNRRKLWDILKKFTKDRIIILTTHYMEEASVLGRRIGILSDGQMKCIGSPLFLIDRFGKSISLTFVKNYKDSRIEDDLDKNIIEFIKEQFKINNSGSTNYKINSEILSEEILIKIPKNSDKIKLNYKSFFEKIDKELNSLQVKSYSASMPTLEDVFLLLSDDIKQGAVLSNMNNINNKSDDNDNSLRENVVLTEKRMDKYEDYSSSIVTNSSVCNDIKWTLIRRIYQAIRNLRIFLLEVLCPIILVLIGLGLSTVEFVTDPPARQLTVSNYNVLQDVFINKIPFRTNTIDLSSENLQSNNNMIKLSFQNYQNTTSTSVVNELISFNNMNYDNFNKVFTKPIFNDSLSNSYLSSLNVLEYNKITNNFEFISFINLKALDASPTMTQEFFTILIKKILNNNNLRIKVS